MALIVFASLNHRYPHIAIRDYPSPHYRRVLCIRCYRTIKSMYPSFIETSVLSYMYKHVEGVGVESTVLHRSVFHYSANRIHVSK